MSTKQLILHPINPTVSLDNTELLIDSLQEAGFLGQAFDLFGHTYYRTGIKFFDFISFDSSHNEVILEEDNGELKSSEVVDSRFNCQIQVTENSETEEVIASAITNLATCPNCQYQVENWSGVISEWYDDKEDAFWRCPQCKTAWKAYQLDWYHTAGFAKYSIRVEQIYPGSAIPTEFLLKLLQDTTGEEWTYMYYWL